MALTDNLVAYYKFDEAAGNGTCDDAFSTKDMSVVGTVTQGAEGKINNCIDTGDANSHVKQSAAAMGAYGTSRSFSFWFYWQAGFTRHRYKTHW